MTPAQRQANRRNARKSTGPRTPEGKARSAQNARKHGLLQCTFSELAGHDAQTWKEFQALCLELEAQFQPCDTIEHALVERVAACFWRIRRARRFEMGAVEEARDEFRRRESNADLRLENFRRSLADARADLQLFEQDLSFLQSLPDLHDPEAGRQAAPQLAKLALNLAVRFAPLSEVLPPPVLAKLLRGQLEDKIEKTTQRIAHLQRCIRDEEVSARHRDGRAHAAALPNYYEMLKLVRYETMLDRQLNKALDQLERRRPRAEPIPRDQFK